MVEFIEREMTKGSVEIKKDMIPVIKYHPYGMEKEIPLYVASSVVSEISPLLLLFKSDINFKTLIIEEPEAHLHPELEQKMAQLIIRIVNSGIPVWVTTHSDTMLQHINNMIKLKKHKQVNVLLKEYGYAKEDLLCSEKVSMYQFTPCEGEMSRLESLECTKYGFVVPTFNDALQSIVDEVYAFQED